jgi:long-chain acyl-CoA synthetase
MPWVSVLVRPTEPENAAARQRIQSYVERLNDSRTEITIGKLVFTGLVFSRENGLLRPNLKLDRTRIARHFQAELESR